MSSKRSWRRTSRCAADWPVDGGTGYDFVNLVLGLLIDASSEAAFDDIYRSFTDVAQSFAEIAIASKFRIMENEMASEIAALSRAAARLAGGNPMTADLTRGTLDRAIRQTIANFPVYRTYVDLAGTPDDADLRDLAWAITRARRSDPDLHPSTFDFLEAALTANAEALRKKELSRTAALRFAMRMQQVSGPVMAKGVEDTAFYRYNRFIALNEVGGAPERFGVQPSTFHKANGQRGGTLAAGDAGERHARHQARRRHARAARRRFRTTRGMAPAGRGVESAPARPHRQCRRGRRARSQRRIHALSDAGRLLADRDARESDGGRVWRPSPNAFAKR